MLVLAVLTTVFLGFRAAGWLGISALDGWILSLRPALAVMFLFTASAHWGKGRPDLLRMVPPSFSNPNFLVTVTGVLEILGAIGVLLPATSRIAAICLISLLIAIFPANIHAARKKLTIRGRPATALPLRIALQMIFIAALIVVVRAA